MMFFIQQEKDKEKVYFVDERPVKHHCQGTCAFDTAFSECWPTTSGDRLQGLWQNYAAHVYCKHGPMFFRRHTRGHFSV